MASTQATPELIDALGALTTLVQAQGAMLMTVIGSQNDVIQCVSKSVLECNQRMHSIIPKLDELLRRDSQPTAIRELLIEPEEHKTSEEPLVTEEPEVFEKDENLDEEHEEPKQPTWEQESDEEEADLDYDAIWGPTGQDAWRPPVAELVAEESSTSVIVEEPLELPEEKEQEAEVEQIDEEEEQLAEEENIDYDAIWGPTGQDAFAPDVEESKACEEEKHAVEVEKSADVERAHQMVVEEERVFEEQEHAGQHKEEEEEKLFVADESTNSLEEEPSDEMVAEEEKNFDGGLLCGRGTEDAFAEVVFEALQCVKSSSTSEPTQELVGKETEVLADKKAQQQQKKRARKDRHRQQNAATDVSTEPIRRESVAPTVPVKGDLKGAHAQAAPTKPPHQHQQKAYHKNGGAAQCVNGGGFRGPRGGFGGPRGGGYGGPRAFNKTPRGSGASLASGKQLFGDRRVDANNNKLQPAEFGPTNNGPSGFANNGFASAKFFGKHPQNAAPRQRLPVSAAAAAAESSIRAEWGNAAEKP